MAHRKTIIAASLAVATAAVVMLAGCGSESAPPDGSGGAAMSTKQEADVVTM